MKHRCPSVTSEDETRTRWSFRKATFLIYILCMPPACFRRETSSGKLPRRSRFQTFVSVVGAHRERLNHSRAKMIKSSPMTRDIHRGSKPLRIYWNSNFAFSLKKPLWNVKRQPLISDFGELSSRKRCISYSEKFLLQLQNYQLASIDDCRVLSISWLRIDNLMSHEEVQW